MSQYSAILVKVDEYRRARIMMTRLLIKALREVYETTKSPMVYLSYRRVLRMIQGERKLSSFDKALLKTTLMVAIEETGQVKRIDRSNTVYAIDKDSLMRIIQFLEDDLKVLSKD